MSRWENALSCWWNAPTWREIGELGGVLIDLYCTSYAAPPKAVSLDVDDTCGVVPGHQQLSLSNAHDDERCFLPNIFATQRLAEAFAAERWLGANMRSRSEREPPASTLSADLDDVAAQTSSCECPGGLSGAPSGWALKSEDFKRALNHTSRQALEFAPAPRHTDRECNSGRSYFAHQS